jgi:transposase-like protein
MQMRKTRKNYPDIFKTKVVLLALRDDVPVSELALNYQVHAKVIHREKKEADASMEAGFSGKLEVQKNDHATEVKELHAGQYRSRRLNF